MSDQVEHTLEYRLSYALAELASLAESSTRTLVKLERNQLGRALFECCEALLSVAQTGRFMAWLTSEQVLRIEGVVDTLQSLARRDEVPF